MLFSIFYFRFAQKRSNYFCLDLRFYCIGCHIGYWSNDPCHIWQLMCSRDNSKSLSAAHDMLFIGAGLGSKGWTLDLKVANHIFSTISGDILVSRSCTTFLGSDQLWSSEVPVFSNPFQQENSKVFCWTCSSIEMNLRNKNCCEANHRIHSQCLLRVLQRPPFWILKIADLTHNLTHDSLTHVYRKPENYYGLSK